MCLDWKIHTIFEETVGWWWTGLLFTCNISKWFQSERRHEKNVQQMQTSYVQQSHQKSLLQFICWDFLFVFILASLLHRIHFVPTKWLFSLKMMINLNSSDECLWLLFLLNFFSKCSRFKTNAGPIDNITLICSGFFVKVFGRIAFEWHNHLNSLYKRTVNYMYIEIMT